MRLLHTVGWAILGAVLLMSIQFALLGLTEPDRAHELPPWGDR